MKTKHQVENELSSLKQKHELESRKLIMEYFGKRADANFIYDHTKSYGGITLSDNLKEALTQYNTSITEADPNLAESVKTRVSVVQNEIQDQYGSLMFKQRQEYKEVADQFPEEDWYLKSIMMENYGCQYTEDECKGLIMRQDKNDIFVLVINEICKEKSIEQNTFVNLISNKKHKVNSQTI